MFKNNYSKKYNLDEINLMKNLEKTYVGVTDHFRIDSFYF